MSSPVSVLIATRDRPSDLASSLSLLLPLRKCVCEVLIIDDGSTSAVDRIVHQIWPEATVVRYDTSAGQCQRRSEGFAMARGDYILQLDDDSTPVNADMVQRAIEILNRDLQLALVAFHIYNGPNLPAGIQQRGPARYTGSFVGCGALIRREAVLQTGGYASFFGNEWEEEELAVRLMKAGWGIWYDPSLIVHHRVSPHNRRSERTWMRGFRNKLWSLCVHFPAHRVIVDGMWVLTVACWDAIRMLRFRFLLQGLWQFGTGLPRALRLRQPMSAATMARLDALRFGQICTYEQFQKPPQIGLRDVWNWYKVTWRNRARQRSFWDRRSGDRGTSPTVGFAHEDTGQ